MKITKEIKTIYTITLPNERMNAVTISQAIIDLAAHADFSDEATITVINNPVSTSYGGSVIITDSKTRYYDENTLDRING